MYALAGVPNSFFLLASWKVFYRKYSIFPQKANYYLFFLTLSHISRCFFAKTLSPLLSKLWWKGGRSGDLRLVRRFDKGTYALHHYHTTGLSLKPTRPPKNFSLPLFPTTVNTTAHHISWLFSLEREVLVLRFLSTFCWWISVLEWTYARQYLLKKLWKW